MRVTLKQAHALACEDPDLIYTEKFDLGTFKEIEGIAILPGGAFVVANWTYTRDSDESHAREVVLFQLKQKRDYLAV